MSNVLSFPVGMLQGVLGAIADELNELAGQRLTRFQGAHSAGATSIIVETTLGWPDSGRLFTGGRAYAYAGRTESPPSFTGLQGVGTTTPGLVSSARDLAGIVDGSGTFSGIENAKRMLFVGSAEGDFLDVLGRNFGLTRPFGVGDVAYRDVIRALAYLPKGTVYAVELLLTLVVGAGNFTVFEDLVNFPNEIFITFADSVTLRDSPKGGAYFNAREPQNATSSVTLDVDNTPIQSDRDNVYAVFLAPGAHIATFVSGVRPSAEVAPWIYGGSAAEAASVVDNGNGSYQFADSSAVLTGPNYTRPLNAEPTTDIHVSWVVRVTAASDDDGTNLRIQDGARGIGVGYDATDVFLYDFGTSSRVGGNTPHGANFHAYRLDKVGTEVRLYQDEVLVSSSAVISFAASAARSVSFGSLGLATTVGAADWADVSAVTIDRTTNYWNELGAADGSTTAGVARIVSAGSLFDDAGDVGRSIRVRNSTAAHGRGNGTYMATAIGAAGIHADVVGAQHTAGDSAEPLDVIDVDRVRIPPSWDAFSPEDAGVQAALATGTIAANNAIAWAAKHAGADGDNITVELIDSPSIPVVAVVVVDDGDGPEDIEVTLDVGVHTAIDVVAAVQANPASAALVNSTTNVGSSSGLGFPLASIAASLTNGEDGKLLTISGSTLGTPNDGTYPISTLIDARTTMVGTHRNPADPQALGAPSLQVEVDLDWRKDPNFATEAAADWELAAGGTLTGAGSKTLNLRQPLPSATAAVIVLYTTVLSAQILEDEFTANANGDTYYPFYLADPLAFVRGLVDAVTVAGVIPRFS